MTKSVPELKVGVEISFSELKEICEFYELHDLWAKIENDPPLMPFKSDGCTMWFDTWQGKSLVPACWFHDLKYWVGYPDESVERLIADAELMVDVAVILGHTHFAELMFHGVRRGGGSFYGRKHSWAFGRSREFEAILGNEHY